MRWGAIIAIVCFLQMLLGAFSTPNPESQEGNGQETPDVDACGGQNLVAINVEINTAAGAVKEGDAVLVKGTVWNQHTQVEANVAILVQKWNGTSWITVDSNRFQHEFTADENATFTFLWRAEPGRYRFVLTADPDNVIGEEDESDNSAWAEVNVPTWATIYGEVNGMDVLGAGAYYFYTWSGPGNGVVIFYDADVGDVNADRLKAMATTAEIERADGVLGTEGNPDCILCRYDADDDGEPDSWYAFNIAGREVNAPVFYVEGWPVGVVWEGDGQEFTGEGAIVFVTEVYEDRACSYSDTGTCDYVVELPSPLKEQYGGGNEIRIKAVR
ncbi:MAG TPA: hypothetical protein EYH14_00470 [Euryarchaeota archaeon]|nr:hypothetical protein [Euryarchaeota archaeon]